MKINSLEGLRGIACFGVFACHFKGAFLPNSFPAWMWNTPLKLLVAGEPFVRIFIALSGFIVALKYFTKENYDDIWMDVPKRYLRLLPMLFLANLLSLVFMATGLYFNQEAGQLSGSTGFLSVFNTFQPDFLLFLKETFVGNYLGTSVNYVSPFWTIEYEFLGVLLVLAIIAVCRKHRIRWIVYAAILLTQNGEWNYLIIGMMAADIYVNTPAAEYLRKYQILNTIILIVILCIFGMQDLHDTNKLWRIGYGTMIAAIFLLMSTNNPAEKILGCGLGRFMGRISFGVYSVHWPMILSLSSFMYLQLPHSKPYLLLIAVVTFAAIIVLAYIFTLLAEKFTIASTRLLAKIKQ